MARNTERTKSELGRQSENGAPPPLNGHYSGSPSLHKRGTNPARAEDLPPPAYAKTAVTVDPATLLASDNLSIPSFTSFDDIFLYIKPWGLWQLITVVVLAFGGMLSCEHVVLHAFVGKTYPHYCQLSQADRTALPMMQNWTENNFREFYIPQKPRDEPPQIGETFHPCKRYLFRDMNLFIHAKSFSDALNVRNRALSRNTNNVTATQLPVIQIVACNVGYYFDTNSSEFKGGVQQEFNLVCERDYLLPIGGTVNMLGILCGAFLSGPISDRFGRRKVVIYFATGMFFVSVANAFSPVYTIFLILRYFTGLFEAGAYTSSFVLIMESIGAKYRGPVGFAFCIPWGLGFVLLSFCAWLFPFWRRLQLAVALPSGILVALYFWLVPESPRWLLLRGRADEAAYYIRQAYIRNHGRLSRRAKKDPSMLDTYDNAVASLFTDADKLAKVLRETLCTSAQQHASSSDSRVIRPRWHSVVIQQTKSLLRSYAHLLSSRTMAKITISMWLIWIANGLVYYGLSLSATELKGFSMFINFALSGVVEVPAYLAAMAITSRTRIGRRYLLFFCMLFAGLMLCGIFVLQIVETAITPASSGATTAALANVPADLYRVQIAIGVLSHAGKFFITASFQMVWIFTSELYPTEIRNLGLGTSSTVCRAVTSLSPILLHLASTMWKLLPTIIFAACALVAAVLCLLPPEMADATLLDLVVVRKRRNNSVQDYNNDAELTADVVHNGVTNNIALKQLPLTDVVAVKKSDGTTPLKPASANGFSESRML